MEKIHVKKCPLCGGEHFSSLFSCVDNYATKETFNLFTCNNCGFIFTQDFPSEQEIGKYYESPNYIAHSDTEEGLMNKLYHLVRSFMLFKKSLLIKRISGKKKGSLLDIGTGTGYFAQKMRSIGWNVKATEKSKDAREFAKENFDLQIDDVSMLNNYENNSFDVITLWHVMEHLEHLNETWIRINELLKEKGNLIIAVPNPTSYDARKYKNNWAAYDVPRHLWHFSPSIMQQFGNKHGFILEEVKPMPFDAFYVSMLTEKNKHSVLPIIKGMISGFIGLLQSFIKKERSSSLIYVFRKK